MKRYVSEAPPSLETENRRGWWLRFTAPPGADQYERANTHKERERLRRSQLTSWTAPFVFFAPLLLLQQAQNGDKGTIIAIGVLMATSVVALGFNRAGNQVVAALLLVLAMDAVIEGTIITAPGGLSSGWLLTFDLFVIPLIAVGVLLGRGFLWGFMLFHVGCILGDFYLLPHAADLVTLIAQWNSPTIAFARPIIIQIGACLLSFLEVRSTDQAILRADRAQEIAELQQTIAEEKRQLEAGVQEIVGILTQAANGHFGIRASLPQGDALWQVASSLNNLFVRLQSSKQKEGMLHQTEQDILYLREALQATLLGRPATWPLPSGGPLDPLIRDLRAAVGLEASPSSPQTPRQPQSTFAPFPHPSDQRQPPRSSPLRWGNRGG